MLLPLHLNLKIVEIKNKSFTFLSVAVKNRQAEENRVWQDPKFKNK
jgi:hypothetical protein